MGGEIDGGIILDELTYAVECLSGCVNVFEDDAQLVGLQGSVAIGHVAMEQIVESLILSNDDAVALLVEVNKS